MKLFKNEGKYAGLNDIDFKIKKGDLVLDVGGGNKPFELSTHVADFIDNEEQRHNKTLCIGSRFLIKGDVAETLKQFPDNYFDFTYSSHTFEHIENLAGALKEISRVSKRGFYALPGSDFEFFTAQEHYGHINLCRQVGDTLHFCKRPPDTVIKEFSEIFERLWRHPQFNPLWETKYRYIWEIRNYWQYRIKFRFYENGEDLYPQLKYFKD